MTTKTPAAEALEDLNDDSMAYEDCMVLRHTTIRKALAIYDKIQRGEWKALAREPISEMFKAGNASKSSEIVNATGVLVTADLHGLFRSMWDAAPAQPETPRADKTEGRG